MRYDWKEFRLALCRAVFRLCLVAAVFGSYVTLLHPKSPLPNHLHPFKPLEVNDQLSVLTAWKLQHVLLDDALCLKALHGTDFSVLEPLDEGEKCYISPRIALRRLQDIALQRVETRCQTALRLAMWERHGLQVAAERHLGQRLTEIRHFSSYSCRELRTPGGFGGRMSSHATADAIDVSGFRVADGSLVDLKADWPGESARSRFLRDALASACLWFPVALGPDYNELHADHFHLQGNGWGLCR